MQAWPPAWVLLHKGSNFAWILQAVRLWSLVRSPPHHPRWLPSPTAQVSRCCSALGLEGPKIQALLPSPGFCWKSLPLLANLATFWLLKTPGNQMGPAVSILSLALSCSCAGCGVSPGCPSLIWSQLQRISKKFFEVFGICMVSFLSFYA